MRSLLARLRRLPHALRVAPFGLATYDPTDRRSWLARMDRLLFGELDWRPELEEGECILKVGGAYDRGGLFGGNNGPLVLTNRRLAWRQAFSGWPLWRSELDLPLVDIEKVEKTTVLSYVFGGHRLQLRLRNGKTHRLWVNDLKAWMEAVNSARAI